MKFLEKFSNLQQRIIGALILVFIGSVFFWDMLNGGATDVAKIIFYIFSFGIFYEVSQLTELRRLPWWSHFISASLFVFILFFELDVRGFSIIHFRDILVISFFAMLFDFWIHRDFQRIKNTLYTFAVFSMYFFALLFMGDWMTHMPFLIFFVFLMTITTDVSAYFIGKKWGDKKLAPSISPNKTWVGFFGGVLTTATLGAFAIHVFPLISILYKMTNVSFLGFLILTCGSVLAQVGDLLESYLKRLHNVKDSGQIIPGHGGLLDRFDSFLFLVFCVGVIFILL
ncbi:MAG: phosphatidate cytidylyltransferase [Alphaproteobacteria bacterium]|nr:phosphatidate cytidylyltransferase [Alphaproteobacteria bacterium]